MTSERPTSAENDRLQTKDVNGNNPWKKWGPYVSERAWGTVREDYSPDGNAWASFTHDMARSKAFRWGEDGLAGYCDRYQILVFSLALWNEKDPILKERAFGLIPTEGNHGEDVKEYYFYLDSTPTHSYMKYLYKYPQNEFPYEKLIEENQKRHGQGPEFELVDTGIFNENRYFDIFVEFAKNNPGETLIKITAHNRGPAPAPLHLIPQIHFRNTWAWGPEPKRQPKITLDQFDHNQITLLADDSDADPLDGLPFAYSLGPTRLTGPGGGLPLFTNNETNTEKLYSSANSSQFVKDAFHRHIIHHENSVNPDLTGTKSAVDYQMVIPAGEYRTITLLLSDNESLKPLELAEEIFEKRKNEADSFYDAIHPPLASDDEKRIQRQALAGMLWSKQFYYFDVHAWLDGDNPQAPPPDSRKRIRNIHWKHLNSMRILSVPDKWEYPWFAAWDLAFHCLALGLVDIHFAKEQLWLMLFEQFQHPNGQIPAYEWEFSDLNPPVHAWAVWRLFHMERLKTGYCDWHFLETCFHKLMLNFTWWVNKVDSGGNNIFEGGFLGLDNITVLDRSEKLADGVELEQADATGWMGMYSLVMMRTALELAKQNPVYEGLATKFFQHYVYVGAAMKNMAGEGVSLWDEIDGFFHDFLQYPDGRHESLRVRSLVGIIPLYAAERLENKWLESFTDFHSRLKWFINNRQDIVRSCCHPVTNDNGEGYILAIFDQSQLLSLLSRIFDKNEFLSEYGIRSLSKYHENQPFRLGGSEVGYEPAEAVSKIKGGNSNWRGPIWFPTTYLIIESLKKLHKAYGSEFKVMIPDGRSLNFSELGHDLADRLISIFKCNPNGQRPVFGDRDLFQNDELWKNHIPFYEYFHGDDGRGLGASHQT
ncbi:MAG: MGH1-like glycoside hydrolase domain-containing protein, partial [bacterium]